MLRKQWKAALASVLMLSLWSDAAGASAHPTLALHLSTDQIRSGGKVVVRATVRGLGGSREYLFRIKNGAGRWTTARRLSTRNRGVLRFAKPGTYWVQAQAVSAGAAKPHSKRQEIFSKPAAVYVGSEVTLTVSAANAAVNAAVVLKAASSNVAHPRYRIEYRPAGGTWSAVGPFAAQHAAHLALSHPGRYQAQVEVKTPGGAIIQSGPISWTVYGPANAITLTGSQKMWVADGTETETLTASVVDAEGDVVANYNGAGTLVDASPNGAISEWGTSPTVLAPVQPGAGIPLTFVNGQATAVLQAGTSIATDSLTAVSTQAPNQVLTGTQTISTVAQKAAGISLTTSSPFLIANESGNPANYDVAVADQAGQPMLSGTYTLTGTIAGPGQFHDLTSGPDTFTYTGGKGPTPITIYSIAGALGPVKLSLSDGTLPTASVSLNASLGGQPYQMGVSAMNSTLSDGQSTTLTLTQLTQTGGFSDPASLDNSGYVVSITDAQGNPASGFNLDGSPYTGPSVSFAVAAGPNYFYAVSQPLTLAVTTAPPGTYDVVVADADGLWKGSTPLAITVTQ